MRSQVLSLEGARFWGTTRTLTVAIENGSIEMTEAVRVSTICTNEALVALLTSSFGQQTLYFP